ncbi:MarR family transcriptional regulator [Candidatus Gracilibacteria bacterium]|nr:MarR family transcriptional regulator [Candidatus Gracilibacteria bacterium]
MEPTMRARRLLDLMHRLRRWQNSPALAQLSACNLSFSHMRLLHLLAPDRIMAMKDLADTLQITPPSMTALTRRLVQTGLVARQTHHEDSRIVLLMLTDAGRQLHQQLHAEQLQRMQELLAALNDAEQVQFLELFERAMARYTADS